MHRLHACVSPACMLVLAPTFDRFTHLGVVTELEKELLNGLRKRGKGGRNQAADARLDPNIDPKKATRM